MNQSALSVSVSSLFFGISSLLYGGQILHLANVSPAGGQVSEGTFTVQSSGSNSTLNLKDVDLDGDGDSSDSLKLVINHPQALWVPSKKQYLSLEKPAAVFQSGDSSKYSLEVIDVKLSGEEKGSVKVNAAFTGFKLSQFAIKKKESVIVSETDHNNRVYRQEAVLLKGKSERTFSIQPSENSSWGVAGFGVSVVVSGMERDSEVTFEKGQRFQIHGLSRQNGEIFSLHAAGNSDGTVFEFGEPRRADIGFHANGMTANAAGDALYILGHKIEEGEELYYTASSMLKPNGDIASTHVASGHAIADEMSVDRSGKYLVASHYRKGIIQSFPILPNKQLGEQIQQINDPRTNGHFVQFSRDNKSVYIPYVKDKTALYQFAFDDSSGRLTAYDPKDVGVSVGPRHLFAHPTVPMIYSSNEQQLGVSGFRAAADGRLTMEQTVESGVLKEGEVVETKLFSSFLKGTKNGEFLFVGSRDWSDGNRDCITTYRVADDGSVTKVAKLPFDHKIPWGVALSPNEDYLIVNSVAYIEAGEVHRVFAYFINKETGELKEVASIPIASQMFSILSVPNRLD